jgi:hypothetical protein
MSAWFYGANQEALPVLGLGASARYCSQYGDAKADEGASAFAGEDMVEPEAG